MSYLSSVLMRVKFLTCQNTCPLHPLLYCIVMFWKAAIQSSSKLLRIRRFTTCQDCLMSPKRWHLAVWSHAIRILVAWRNWGKPTDLGFPAIVWRCQQDSLWSVFLHDGTSVIWFQIRFAGTTIIRFNRFDAALLHIQELCMHVALSHFSFSASSNRK